MTVQITRSGITWTLAGSPTNGTYMNGDPWVVGPVQVTAISPGTQTMGSGRIINGSEKNMRRRDNASVTWDDFLQGLDSGSAASTYDPAVNAGTSIPLDLVAGDSLVSVESDQQNSGWVNCINHAAVLTVVATPPPANAFRPPYWYPDRPSADYIWDDSMLDALPSTFPSSYGSDIIAMGDKLSELWMSCGQNQGSYLLLPKLQCYPYYRERNIELGWMLMALCSNIPKAQKRSLCIAMCQYGIDLAWAVKNGQYFASRHATGRKAPIVFMASVTGFADFQDVNGLCPSGTMTPKGSALPQDHRTVWGEDGQTFYVEETSPGAINWNQGRYTLADIGKPDWGNDHWMEQGATDWFDWTSEVGIRGYRKCCSANGWFGMQLAMRAMGLEKMWGHDAWFDYLHRFRTDAPTYGYPDWQRDYTQSLIQVWDDYGAHLAINGRSIGLAGPGKPRMTQLTTAGTENPWQLRIESGQPVPVIGILMRTEETAIRPKQSFWGVPTKGLVFLDQDTYTGHIPVLIPPTGATVDLPAIDDAGATYSLQAAILIGSDLVTTNALQVSIVDGV